MSPKGNDMSDELVERLRKLAEKATPGERELNGAGQLVIDDGPPLFELPRRTKHYTADHWFIAACSPDKILALLARLSRPSTVAVARDALEAIAQLSVSEVMEPREALERIIVANQECAQAALIALNGAGIRLADGTVTGGHPSPQGGAEPDGPGYMEAIAAGCYPCSDPPLGEAAQAMERAYGILWRDHSSSEKAIDARKELLAALPKVARQRGIKYAIERYGPTTEKEILEAGI